MARYSELSRQELETLRTELTERYEQFKRRGLKLDMSRGKPSSDQLDLANGLFDVVDRKSTRLNSSHS